MKTLKKILLFVGVLLAVAIVYVMLFPSQYDVSRSLKIQAPVGKVFETVNEMKTWEEWGPWHDEDSTIVVTYGEKTSGVGAYNSWTSKDGPGNMTTVQVKNNELIEQKMQFGDFEPSDVIWKFEETEDGVNVTWQMKEENAPMIFKAFAALSGGWDKMLGPMQERGLENLSNVIAEQIKLENSFSISDLKPQDYKPQNFIGYYVKMKIDHEEMTKAFMKHMPKAGEYAMKSGLKYGDFMPSAVYTNYNEEGNICEFYIGLILHKPLKAGEGMVSLNLPSGKGVMVSKFGNYGNGDEAAHQKISDYLAANNLKQRWPMWETYPNDPTLVKPQEIQTDIFYAVEEIK
ncbi:MAG: hypothetical protein CMB99_06115 [Flavobacteriaceae bacterium]|nr:hypothetical protein [Flavobacteriaceae bacterium]|tara:strand:- start:5658 stop:6692 length:1035 start_codon:yes stop_codon:yes gene_type:complete